MSQDIETQEPETQQKTPEEIAAEVAQKAKEKYEKAVIFMGDLTSRESGLTEDGHGGIYLGTVPFGD